MAYQGKYSSPDALMRDDSLTRDERIRMLESWRDDKKALMRASDEGMEGVSRADLLKQIKKSLRSLHEGS